MIQLAPPTAPDVVDVFQGAVLASGPYRAASDTTLDPGSDETLGGLDTLFSGDGRTLLLRWADLRRVLGDRTIADARIVLSGGGEDLTLLRAARLEAGWSEGPRPTLVGARAAAAAEAAETARLPKNSPWSTTHRARHFGALDWQSAGARGPGDATTIEGVTVRREGDLVVVEGLVAAVARMRDRPERNFGLLLEFAKPVAFASAEAGEGRPRLSVTLGALRGVGGRNLRIETLRPEGGAFVATVRNLGDAPETGARLAWARDDKEAGEVELASIPAGGTVTARLAGTEIADPKDDRRGAVTARLLLNKPDARPDDDALVAYPGGFDLDLDAPSWPFARALVENFNENAAPGSRFSFAPEGTRRRVNLGRVGSGGLKLPDDPRAALGVIVRAMGAPDAAALDVLPFRDRFGGVNGGDTRWEGGLAATLAPPQGAWTLPVFESARLEPQGWLSATDVGALEARGASAALPKTMLLRIQDGRGVGIPNLPFRLGDEERTTGAGGVVVATPAEIFKKGNALVIGASLNGAAAVASLKRWQLEDVARRGATSAAVVDVRLDLPLAPVDDKADLAAGRLVTDSANRLPGELTGLTDGTMVPPLVLKAGDWIEVDLARDRTVAAVELRLTPGAGLVAFDLVGYGTGQRLEDATVLSREVDLPWSLAARAKDGVIRYYGQPLQLRYVRLIARSSGTLPLRGWSIRPVATLP